MGTNTEVPVPRVECAIASEVFSRSVVTGRGRAGARAHAVRLNALQVATVQEHRGRGMVFARPSSSREHALRAQVSKQKAEGRVVGAHSACRAPRCCVEVVRLRSGKGACRRRSERKQHDRDSAKRQASQENRAAKRVRWLNGGYRQAGSPAG